MIRFLVHRVLLAVVVLFGVSIAVFSMLHAIPGDPVVVMLSTHATPGEEEQLRHELGLDKPVYVQYARYVDRIFHGDLGRSVTQFSAVSTLISERIWNTVELAVMALLFAVVLGVPIGLISAHFRGRSLDRIAMTGSVVGVSIPSFWLGIMLLLFFGLRLRWLPIAGKQGFDSVILPAITLAMIPLATISRLTRSSLIDVLREDYIRTAISKGISQRRVLVRHALRNALIPLITIIGLLFGTLLSGAVIVESVFAWPGIGSLLINAVQERDYPLIQGIILLIAVIFVTINLVVDILYAVVDPRVRSQIGGRR
jgi:peptide/nickel transport system permease protein